MHVLQSKHIKLNEKEVKELLEKFNISKNQLPKIKKKDAALQEMDVKSGDIIKIERKSFGLKSEYFRIVI